MLTVKAPNSSSFSDGRIRSKLSKTESDEMDMCQFCLKPTKSNMTFMIEIFCYLLAVKHNFVFPAFWSQPSFGTKKEKQVSSKKQYHAIFVMVTSAIHLHRKLIQITN